MKYEYRVISGICCILCCAGAVCVNVYNKSFSQKSILTDYLASYGQDCFESDFICLKQAEGFAYTGTERGIHIYYAGFPCGSIVMKNFGDENWVNNTDFVVAYQYSGTDGQYERIEHRVGEYGDCFIYKGKKLPFVYSDTEWLVENGIFDSAEKACEECMESYVVLYGKEGSEYGYSLLLNQYFFNGTTLENLLKAVSFSEDSFTEVNYEKALFQNTYPAAGDEKQVISIENAENIAYEIAAGDLIYRVPQNTVAVKTAANEWSIYCYNKEGGDIEVGKITVCHNTNSRNPKELLESAVLMNYEDSYLEKTEYGFLYSYFYQEDIFSEKQKQRICHRENGNLLAESVKRRQHTFLVSGNGMDVIEIKLDFFGEEAEK